MTSLRLFAGVLLSLPAHPADAGDITRLSSIVAMYDQYTLSIRLNHPGFRFPSTPGYNADQTPPRMQ